MNEVFDTITNGAVLRSAATFDPSYDFFDTSSRWGISIEEQDAENGGLLQEVNVYLDFIDNTDGNGTTVILASSDTEMPRVFTGTVPV